MPTKKSNYRGKRAKGKAMAGRRRRRPARKSWHQNQGTHVEWFKSTGDITSSPQGTIWLPTSANDVFPIPSFVTACRAWEQYKVLKVIVKFYAAYVGSESDQPTPAGYRRGNTVTYIDQPPLQAQPSAGQISTVMGFPSAKLHQSRMTIKRWMSRPSGGRFMDWAYITHPTAIGLPTIAQDAWSSRICLFGDGFAPQPATATRPYWFVETLYKVVFRSKYRSGAP